MLNKEQMLATLTGCAETIGMRYGKTYQTLEVAAIFGCNDTDELIRKLRKASISIQTNCKAVQAAMIMLDLDTTGRSITDPIGDPRARVHIVQHVTAAWKPRQALAEGIQLIVDYLVETQPVRR